MVDPTITTSERGIWAIKWSFLALAITASIQVGVAWLSGSVGLLASSDATPNGVINGTAMVRPASATAAIGGPAKNVGGVINGTTIRPK